MEQVTLRIRAERADNLETQRQHVAKAIGMKPEAIKEWRLLKRSIDARQKIIMMQMVFEVSTHAPLEDRPNVPCKLPSPPLGSPEVVIVGCGPSGLFAAQECLRRGMRPILLERGKDVSSRRFDLAPILRKGTIPEDSNYAFGEGGAGTFSDGKLYTRATKRGPVADVYQTLVAHGAPEDILVDAHPHIGSNLLPNVVRHMREAVVQAGGEVHFGARVCELILHNHQIKGVVCANGMNFMAENLILATGHSARDIYLLLHQHGIRLEPKPFAMGVRAEHPQPLVDQHQYHLVRDQQRPDYLPAASYRLATKIKHRGVHSFCMCPGGFIVPAATSNDQIVVNGMSLSRRDSPFANSGMVVTVEPEDVTDLDHPNPLLAGMRYQEQLEQATKSHGGPGQVAPAQRITDFLSNRTSATLPRSSYHPGICSVNLRSLLPEGITWRLEQGLKLFARQFPSFITEEGILVGSETRTSSPLRIPRHPLTLQHPEVEGLYPCGEGAGFAGGIVSAALDGIRCAQALAAKLA